jgi:hypothetical protein
MNTIIIYLLLLCQVVRLLRFIIITTNGLQRMMMMMIKQNKNDIICYDPEREVFMRIITVLITSDFTHAKGGDE